LYTFDFRLSAGDKNAGTVYLPSEDPVCLPVMIYCHGWGGSRKLWEPTEKLCERAMKENIAFVAFDFFGCGETGGDSGKMTYGRWKDNLSDILNWIFKQTFTDKSRIGCYAFSSGSTAALRLSAEDERLSFVISVGTCLSTHIGMNGGGPAKLFAENYNYLSSGGTVKFFGADLGIDFYIDVLSKAPIHMMNKIKCPVLFLQGTADNVFRCADARMGYEIMKHAGLSAAYIELEGGSHGLDNMSDAAAGHVFNWLLPIIRE
jgi:pimeloyl-ACP methyl ester carboxylesterase